MPARSSKKRQSSASKQSSLARVLFAFRIRAAKSQNFSEWTAWWARTPWKSSGVTRPPMATTSPRSTRVQAVRDAGYKPVRVMFYYPNRDQAIRIQKALESLYMGVQGEYHYAEAAWAYVKRRTGVNLLR